MPAPAPYRLYDPIRREVIEDAPDEGRAYLRALELVDDEAYERVEIQHLEDGLFDYDYYRVDEVDEDRIPG